MPILTLDFEREQALVVAVARRERVDPLERRQHRKPMPLDVVHRGGAHFVVKQLVAAVRDLAAQEHFL